MAPCMQRKYIDLIFKVSRKWVNWNPPIDIRVGSYGTIDKKTGDLLVEGNIYDLDFQEELHKHGVDISMANYPAQDGPVESDFFIGSGGAEFQDVGSDNDIANAHFKGQWLFERGKRHAILVMHSPHQVFLPSEVTQRLSKVDKLVKKHLVTSVHVCSAYSMYLSDTSVDQVSLALVSQGPTAGSQSFSWRIDPKIGLFRMACDQNYKFTPLYSLMRLIKRSNRLFRDSVQPDPSGDNLWCEASPPWDPLDENGVEDRFSSEVTDADPFNNVAPA